MYVHVKQTNFIKINNTLKTSSIDSLYKLKESY